MALGGVARLRPWQGNWKAKFMAFFSLKPSASPENAPLGANIAQGIDIFWD
jgi:hypothetical protein